jgi:NADPH2:quinone reductase
MAVLETIRAAIRAACRKEQNRGPSTHLARTSMTTPNSGLQLRSCVTRGDSASGEGVLRIALHATRVAALADDEVLVQIQATPINPSDIGLLFGAADMARAIVSGGGTAAVVQAPVPAAAMKAMAGRLDQDLPVGNEGAGLVIAAGSAPAAQALMGRTVAVLGGAMYAQLRTLKAAQCLPLPAGTTAAEGASCFVNPLTALGMVETMRREGHTALVHTAAASNLGQMLNRIALKDGFGLVNIVRKPEQAALLKGQGAQHVCVTSSPGFMDELTQALVATGATIAFDATGGGRLAGQILTAMEAALNRTATEYSRYGSTTHKQVYIYGGLDTGPTEFVRNFGFSWGLGGWLLFPFLQRVGAERAQAMRERVAAELKTTFASHYAGEISLAQALQREMLARYGQRTTGEKWLINPSL